LAFDGIKPRAKFVQVLRRGDFGYVPVGSTPAEFRARIDSEIDKWTRIIQAANIKPN